MNDITVLGKINFIEDTLKEFDCSFEAKLTSSSAFSYGNGTCVTIEYGPYPNGRKRQPDLIDTRYDVDLERTIPSFIEWLKEYFNNKLCPHELKITGSVESKVDEQK